MGITRLVFSILFVVFLISCQRTYGIYHNVRPGENLYRISLKYKKNPKELAQINDIQDPTKLSTGERIFVPGVKPPKKSFFKRTHRQHTLKKFALIHPRPPRGHFLWPIKSGRLTSNYGPRRGSLHDGIDIGARKGTPIRAVADGRVIHSGRKLKGYGNLIIIKHKGRLSSVYAHNEINYVREKDFVKKGEIIGRVGRTGRATGPHLHFEIREGRVAVNPLPYLPNLN